MVEKLKISEANLSILGILIRVARLKQGYSLRNLSSLTQFSHTLISNIEKGKQIPSEETLIDIFKVLKLKLFTSKNIEEEMTYYFNTIFSHIINHHYELAEKLVKEMEKNSHQYENSYEVVNYFIIRCLFYSITNTDLEEKEERISQYGKVFELFNPKQKQLLYFIKGLDYLNDDNYKLASDNFEMAIKIGDRDINSLIKEYLVKSYIDQYKFTDSVSIAQTVIEDFEEKTIYIRAMNCRLLIARVYLKILKLDEAEKLISYVESFAMQYKVDILLDKCHILKSEILFFKLDYKEATKELNLSKLKDSKDVTFLKFRILLMSKASHLFDYYYDVMNNKKENITTKDYLLIKVLMMWINIEVRNDEEYVDSLNQLVKLSIAANDQEIIGVAHNLLIMFYREKRRYKRALEIAETLLIHKKIHISYYSVKK